MSTPPNRGHRTAAARGLLATLVGLLASALCLVPATPAATAEPVEDMGCRMVIWASDSVFETSYDHVGMRHKFRGCRVRRGWSTRAYRAVKNRQWALNNHLSSAECRVGTTTCPASAARPTWASASSCSSTDSTTWCPAEQDSSGTVGGFAAR